MHAQREDHVRIQPQDGQVQAGERGLGRNQTCDTLSLQNCEEIIPVVHTPLVCGTWPWQL